MKVGILADEIAPGSAPKLIGQAIKALRELGHEAQALVLVEKPYQKKYHDVKHFWDRAKYMGDNDVFQMMLKDGKARVAYNHNLEIYHHTVGTLFDWIGKWKRNLSKHFLTKWKTRNLNWINVKHFKLKLILRVIYSLVLPVSILHAIFLALRDKDIYWLYHPLMSFLRFFTYTTLIISRRNGRNFIKNTILGVSRTTEKIT